jgi:hypothetical protein
MDVDADTFFTGPLSGCSVGVQYNKRPPFQARIVHCNAGSPLAECVGPDDCPVPWLEWDPILQTSKDKKFSTRRTAKYVNPQNHQVLEGAEARDLRGRRRHGVWKTTKVTGEEIEFGLKRTAMQTTMTKLFLDHREQCRQKQDPGYFEPEWDVSSISHIGSYMSRGGKDDTGDVGWLWGVKDQVGGGWNIYENRVRSDSYDRLDGLFSMVTRTKT